MSWQNKYQKAIHFAAEAHGDQKYPGKSYSYVVHLSLVAMEVTAAVTNALARGESLDADLAVQCAILHDTLEDTGIEYSKIEEIFGKKVADGVQALSKDKSLDRQERMADSLKRIKKQPREVWMVKMADRITNLQPPPTHWTAEKIAEYKKEALQIYREFRAADEFLARRLHDKIESYGR